MAARRISGSWWVDFAFRGRRYRLRSPDNHREGATAYEHALRRQLSDDKPVYLASDPRSRLKPASESVFGAFAAEWFETYVKTYLKPATQLRYEQLYRRRILPRFGKFPLAAIVSSEINAFAGELLRSGLKAKSVNGVLSALRGCLDKAVEWERLDHVPRITWLKSEPSTFDYLSPAESRRLLVVVRRPPYHAMVHMALRTGMRIGELLALRWEDIDLEQRLIAVRRSRSRGIESSPKTYRHRYIPITSDLCESLSASPSRSGYVFSVRGDGREPVNDDVARVFLRRAVKKAGLRAIGWHVLRHSFASQLASEGVSIYVVQALLGHTTVQMTMRYAHLAPSTLRGAVEILVEAGKREILDGRQGAVNERQTDGERRTLPKLASPSVSAVPSKKVHLSVNFIAGAVGET
jgi:integrase